MNEVWKDIVGWEGLYQVSSLGRIMSMPRVVQKGNHTLTVRGRILKPAMTNGYLFCVLSRGGEAISVRVHVAVASAFKGSRPSGRDVRHRDGDKTNNRSDNIDYGTRAQNEEDKVAHGTSNRGERCASAKLNKNDVMEIRRRYAVGDVSQKSLGVEYGVAELTIHRILKGQSWGWL